MPHHQLNSKKTAFKKNNQELINATIEEGNKLAQDWIAEGFNLQNTKRHFDVKRTDEWVSFSESNYYAQYKTLFPLKTKEYRYATDAFHLLINSFKDNQTFDSAQLVKNFNAKIKQECSRIDLDEDLGLSDIDLNAVEQTDNNNINGHVKTERSCQIM